MRLLRLQLDYDVKLYPTEINEINHVWRSEIAERYTALMDFYSTKRQTWKYCPEFHITSYNDLLNHLVWRKPYIPQYTNAALDMLKWNVVKNIYILLNPHAVCESGISDKNIERIKERIYKILTIDSTGELCYYPTRTDDMIIFSLTQTKR